MFCGIIHVINVRLETLTSTVEYLGLNVIQQWLLPFYYHLHKPRLEEGQR